VRYEKEYIRKDGTRVPIELFVNLSRDVAGQPEFYYAFVSDITARKQAEERLRASEKRFRALTEKGTELISVVDTAGVLTYESPNETRILGYPVGEQLGTCMFKLVHPDDLPVTRSLFQELIAKSGSSRTTELRARTKDGSWRWLEIVGTNLLADPAVAGIVLNARDITDRKAAEQALRESEASLKRAQEIGHLGSWELDLAANQLTWSDEVYRIFGLQPQEFGATYEGFLDRVHPDDRAAVDAAYSGSLREERDSYEIEHRIVRKDTGEIRYVQEKCQHVRDAQGHVVQSLGMVLDITERKAAEEALKRAHDELEIKVRERTSDLSDAVERLRVENIQRKRLEDTLRESENKVRFFASQCLTAQETERKRIASELHDSIAASLAAVRLRIERMAEETEPGSGSSESLESIASRVAEITTDVRRIMADLRPSILDDLGIMAALNWFCREFQKTYSHFSVERRIGIDEHEVPDTLKTPIFRICQEAMNNCAKHSRGSLVKVSLQKEGERILLSVQDNGQGFDLEKVNKGMGLSNIRERAELSGGASEFESAIGEGTTVRVWWPTPVGNVG
ncbi:MAG: PAS domain S-box protein, partial [Deltaproteobacteria bacterium]